MSRPPGPTDGGARALVRAVLFGDGRVRAGWRLLLFAGVFVAGLMAGSSALHLAGVVLTEETRLTVGGAVMLLAALVAGWIMLATLEGRPAGALGFGLVRRAPAEAGVGFAVGVAALAVVIAALAAAGMVRFRPDAGGVGDYVASLLGTLLILALPAAAEEALFRGYPFQVLVEGIGALAATLVASALFAAAHLGNPNVGSVALLNIFLAGVLLSVVYLRTRSLWAATGVHLGWNWAVAGLFDLPVSGLELVDTPLYDVVTRGPEWVTGGAFGPEGGLAGTVAFAVALAVVARWEWFRESPGMARLRPIVDRTSDVPIVE